MVATYVTPEQVGAHLGLAFDEPDDLNGDAASGQAVIPLNSTAKYASLAGLQVRIFDSDTPSGELGTILSVQADTSITLSANLANSYTTASSAQVQIQSPFSDTCVPNRSQMVEWVEEAEERMTEDLGGQSFIPQTFPASRDGDAFASYDFYPSDPRQFWGPGDRMARFYTVLGKRDIAAVSVLKAWNGSEYIDVLNDKTEGRLNDYVIEQRQGIVYWFNFRPQLGRNVVQAVFTYGGTDVPKWARRAASLLVQIDFWESDLYARKAPDGEDTRRMTTADYIAKAEARYEKIIAQNVIPGYATFTG